MSIQENEGHGFLCKVLNKNSLFKQICAFKMFLFLTAIAFLRVNSLDIKADIFAVPFHKLVFTSSHALPEQDLIPVKLLDQDLKCFIQPQVDSKEEVVQEESLDNILEIAIQTVYQMSCLKWDLGFWRYEFCPRTGMSQFHQIPEKGIVLQYDLGNKVLKTDLGTINDTHSFSYASLTLGKGTICDVTGEPRTIEIQIHCKQDVNDHISKVSEVSTCKYLAIIYTSKICKVSSRFIPRTVLEERLITCYGSQVDGSILSFFDNYQDDLISQEDEKKDDDSQEDLLSIAKKLLEQNGYSMEIINLDQNL